MPPTDWPIWTQAIAGSGAVAAATLAVLALLGQIGRGMSTAAGWIHEIVVDAVTKVVRDHAPSVEQVTEIVEAKTALLHTELMVNGGKSLKDQVTRIERRLDEHMVWSEDEANRVQAQFEQDERNRRDGTD